MILPEGANLSADLLRRVEYFTETYCQKYERLYQYGWGHLLFACYAAFPAHLTPDLLHKLRLNFRHYSIPQLSGKHDRGEIHPVAVNDLLLSNLVQETGFERYEMPEEIRHYLLWLLQHHNFFKKKGISPIQPHEKQPHVKAAVTRLNHLADFLLRYTTDHYTATDPVTRSLREAQEWTAQAWLDPVLAARRIREKLSGATPNEQYHYSRLGNRLAAQYNLHLNPASTDAPASFSALHTYTQGMTSLYSGKMTQAQDYFSKLKDLRATEGTAVASTRGTIMLPVPTAVVKQLLINRPDLTNPTKPDTPEQPLGSKPMHWRNRETRLRSPFPKAVLTISDGEIQDILRALTRMERELREQLNGGPDFCLGDFYDLIIGNNKSAEIATMLAARRQVVEINSDIDLGAKTLRDTLFLSGLAIFNMTDDGWQYKQNLPGNWNFIHTSTYVQAEFAISPPSGASNLNSFDLDVTALLIEAREKLQWPKAPDDLLWVSVDTEADKSPEPLKADVPLPVSKQLERDIQTDLRWLQRHTFDLLGQHWLRYHAWDCSEEKDGGIEWPEQWYAPPTLREAQNEAAVSTEIYIVTAKSLTLRVVPSDALDRVGQLQKGTQVELMGTEEDWVQVRVLKPTQKTGNEGWTMRKFIELLSEQKPEKETKGEAQKADKRTPSATIPPDSIDGQGESLDIQQLISLGDTEKALALLATRFPNEAALLQAQYFGDKKKFNLSLIDYSDWQRIQSRVNFAILELAGQVKSGDIQQLISLGDTEKALALLSTRFPNEASLLQAQYFRGKKDFNLNMIDYSDWQRIQARVNYSILELARTINKSDISAADTPQFATTSKIKKIYIAYAFDDTKTAVQVQDVLKKEGFETIIDRDNLEIGMTDTQFIQESVKKADCVIAIFSSRSLQSGSFGQGATLSMFNEVLSNRMFLPVRLDNLVFDEDYITKNVEDNIKELDQRISESKKLQADFRAFEDNRKQLLELRSQLSNIIDRLKSINTIDISGSNFTSGMDKIIDSIRKA